MLKNMPNTKERLIGTEQQENNAEDAAVFAPEELTYLEKGYDTNHGKNG